MTLASTIRSDLAAIARDTGGLSEALTIGGTTVYGVPRASYQGVQFGISEVSGMVRSFRCVTSDLAAIPTSLNSVLVHAGKTYAIMHMAPDEQSGLTLIEVAS